MSRGGAVECGTRILRVIHGRDEHPSGASIGLAHRGPRTPVPHEDEPNRCSAERIWGTSDRGAAARPSLSFPAASAQAGFKRPLRKRLLKRMFAGPGALLRGTGIDYKTRGNASSLDLFR